MQLAQANIAMNNPEAGVNETHFLHLFKPFFPALPPLSGSSSSVLFTDFPVYLPTKDTDDNVDYNLTRLRLPITRIVNEFTEILVTSLPPIKSRYHVERLPSC